MSGPNAPMCKCRVMKNMMTMTTIIMMMTMTTIVMVPHCQGIINSDMGARTIEDVSKGDFFVLGFMKNYEPLIKAELLISTHSVDPVEVTVDIPLVGWTLTVYVTHGQPEMVCLPSYVYGVYDVELTDNGIRVRANASISVHGHPKSAFAADMYLALPMALLGTTYFAITYPMYPSLMVVAAYGDTDVCISFPSNLTYTISFNGTNYTGGQDLCLTLGAYQAFSVLINENIELHTLSGTRITSNKPLSAFSGSKCVIVDGLKFDHLAEMLLPKNLHGNRYYSVHTPAASREEDIYIFMATEYYTEVTVGADPPVVLAEPGDYLQLELDMDSFVVITGNDTFQAAMISKSNEYDSPHGLPSLVLLIPEKLFGQSYQWETPLAAIHTLPMNHSLVIVIDQSFKHGLILDGDAYADWTGVTENSFTSSGKVHLSLSVSDTPHSLTHTHRYGVFSAMITGVGIIFEISYMAPAGLGQMITRCRITGDPHLMTFSKSKAPLPLPCAYHLTSLRLTNSLYLEGHPFYSQMDVEVKGGNSQRQLVSRVYASDVSVTVTFRNSDSVGPSNTYSIGELLLPVNWVVSYPGEAMQGRVVLAYDTVNRSASLKISGTEFLLVWEPVNRAGGPPDLYNWPGIRIWVGSSSLIYESSIGFPSTMCDTIETELQPISVPGLPDTHVAIYGLTEMLVPNLEDGDQDDFCPAFASELSACNASTFHAHFQECFSLSLKRRVMKCVYMNNFTIVNLSLDCFRVLCSGQSCESLPPYNQLCPIVGVLVPQLHC